MVVPLDGKQEALNKEIKMIFKLLRYPFET